MVKWLGTTGVPRTPTERPSSISRARRRASSTGRMLDRKARANAPSTMRSSRRSNPRIATATQVTGALGGSTGAPWGDGGRGRAIFLVLSLGRVAELADALASGASGRKVVGVQVPPRPRGSRKSAGVRDRRIGQDLGCKQQGVLGVIEWCTALGVDPGGGGVASVSGRLDVDRRPTRA